MSDVYAKSRVLKINQHDTHVGIWQDNANDPTFYNEIYRGLLRLLQRLGWRVTADPQTLKRFRSISKNYRLASRGTLGAHIQCSGRVVQIDFWSELAAQDNPNGRRYDFDKWKRAPYLDRVRIDLETRRILAWLDDRATLTFETRRDVQCGFGFDQVPARAFIDHRIRSTGHFVPELGRARFCNAPREQTSGDGLILEHGAVVWFRDRSGRILRGRGFYVLGQQWLIQVGRWGVYNASHWDIFVQPPADLRSKQNKGQQRKRLEQELSRAIIRDEFRRAEKLKSILFGGQPIYRIYSKKNGSYYGQSFCGYATDRTSAGRYTREEAEAEVRRVPHILLLVTPDGRRLTADEIDASAGPVPFALPSPVREKEAAL